MFFCLVLMWLLKILELLTIVVPNFPVNVFGVASSQGDTRLEIRCFSFLSASEVLHLCLSVGVLKTLE